MTIVVLADRDDAAGFGLAGLPAFTCGDVAALAEGLRTVDMTPGVGLVIVSRAAAALAPERIVALRARPGAPVVVVLPAPAVPPEKGELP